MSRLLHSYPTSSLSLNNIIIASYETNHFIYLIAVWPGVESRKKAAIFHKLLYLNIPTAHNNVKLFSLFFTELLTGPHSTPSAVAVDYVVWYG